MKGQLVVRVDAFTDRMYSGNPAAVCILEGPRSAEWMQQVAMELNVSVTAFLQRDADLYQLRWFTPSVEVDLCGHATLASAHVLWQDGHLVSGQPAEFSTRSGKLTARRDGDWITLDFPASVARPARAPPTLIEGLGVRPTEVGLTAFDYLVEVDHADQVRALEPNFAQLERVEMRGVIVTARSDQPDFDFISRFFAPRIGLHEDPVSGSTHCALGPHWAAKLGKSRLTGYQASRRGGVIRVEVRGDRTHLSGRAVTVMRGELLG